MIPTEAQVVELGQRGNAIAARLNDQLVRLKRSRIKVAPPNSAHTRGSSLGHECERFLAYERTENPRRKPHNERLQALFDLGNELERYVVHEMEAAGIVVVQRGRDWVDERLDISGHVDCSIAVAGAHGDPATAVTVPVEIKGLNQFTAGTIETAQDIRFHRSAWVRRYYGQLQTYLYLEGKELGLYALLDKSAGWLRFIPAVLDYDFAEALLRRAEHVRDAVRAGALPDRNVSEDCEQCAFLHLCTPDRLFGAGTGELPAEVAALLDRRAALKPHADEFKEVDEQVKGMVPEKDANWIAGGWGISCKGSPRKSFTVAAGTTYRRTYTRIAKPQGSTT